MVYGCPVWGSSAHDVGNANRQLAGFRLNPDLLVKMLGYGSSSRYSWWLSSVVSSTLFAIVNYDGNAYYVSASYALGVVPVIVFG